nr:DUF724 domain-containing protein 3 [Ipomoea batatas]
MQASWESYYEATIVGQLTTGDVYVVEYKNLVTDDFSAPLTENVPVAQIRPQPVQVVDAFDNEGWWVGQITGEYKNSYYVYFEHYDLIGRVVSIHQPKDIQVKQNSQRLIDFVIEDCSLPRFLTPVRTISSRSRNTGFGSLETMSNENITMTSLLDIYDDKKVKNIYTQSILNSYNIQLLNY